VVKALIEGTDRFARAVNLNGPRLDAAQLLRQTAHEHWLTKHPSRCQALVMLLESIEREAVLSLFGRYSLRWDLCRLLRNGARVESQLALQPHIEQTPVAAPIVILGLPRTGTTFLHRVLAEDPENAVLRCWQTLEPALRPRHFDPRRDARARRTERKLQMFRRMAPGLASLHPLGADLPQECGEINAHTFRSFTFDSMLHVPAYRDWLDQNGHDDAYAFHRRFLQLLQDGTPCRWVLKCPDHVFALDSLLKTYPDARFVVTHRDPLMVIPSVARLTQVLREPFSRHVDPHEVGPEVAQRWIEGGQRLIAFDRRADVPGARVLHVHHADIIADPVAVLQRIYRCFDLPLETPTLQRLRRFFESHPRGDYGRNNYSLEAFGLERRALEQGFASYRRHFQLGPRSFSRHPSRPAVVTERPPARGS
jgi:hypothetical protein